MTIKAHDPDYDGEAIEPIDKTVERASVEKEDDEGNMAYADAMSYFLDDRTDVEMRPPATKVDIERMDEETGEMRTIFTCHIKALDDAAIKSCQKRSRERGPRGVRSSQSETDEIRFYTLVCVEGITTPNLMDDRIINKYNTPDAALRAKLLPGERASLADYILGFSGFGDAAKAHNKEVEAAKN